MKQKFYLSLIIIVFLLFCYSIFADWEPIITGFDYQQFTLPDPNNVYVARMDRNNTDCVIDSCIGQGYFHIIDWPAGRARVSQMATMYDEAINYWGEGPGHNYWGTRNDVVVAINGDGFDGLAQFGVPTGGQMISGWYAKRFGEFSTPGMAYTLNRYVFMGGYINHPSNKNLVTYPTLGQNQTINGINIERESDKLIIYTPHYNTNTQTDNSGVEVLVELSTPLLIKPVPNYVSGYVKEVRINQGSTIIPFDHIVLSATGSASTKLSSLNVGDEVRVSMELNHYEGDPGDYTKTYSCIGYMTFRFLIDGVIPSSTHPNWNDHEPRTAVAYNNDYIYFLVVDGRTSISVGMTMPEIGNFCITYLSATDGINQDGGGSSAIWVNGQIKNSPSDGAERYVANGLMMVKVLAKQQTTTFSSGQGVKTLTSTQIRQGPGTNYKALATIPVDTNGQIVSHSLNGILAKGQNWWKCQFGSNTGWVQENQLITTMSAEIWKEY